MKSVIRSIAVTLVTLGVVEVASAIPQLINYQGYLTDDLGNPVADGNYRLVFRIWDAETGPHELWSEDPNPSPPILHSSCRSSQRGATISFHSSAEPPPRTWSLSTALSKMDMRKLS